MAENTITKYFAEKKQQRAIKRLKSFIAQIRAEETKLRQQTDLVAKTTELKAKAQNGVKLEDLIVPAFATVAEATRRVIGQEAYDAQIMGGLILHKGAIAEMKAGEGKTLTAVMPAYLNALRDTVHVATQNDYLTRRDFQHKGPIFEALGIPVAYVTSDMKIPDRVKAYGASVVYATNHELVFDYLHDQMRYPGDDRIIPRREFAIIDEIDSILIDEARTPLIISELKESPEIQLQKYTQIVRALNPDEDYVVDRRLNTAFFQPSAFKKIEELLPSYGLQNVKRPDLIFYLDKALKAETLFDEGRHYLVRDGRVMIVDEFTGRLMADRRYMEGIHQAIEAKHGLMVGPTDRILASMTYQNFFRRYQKLAGISGTIFPEEKELKEIYGVDTIQVPTNKPLIREDRPTKFFLTKDAKMAAVLKEVKQAQEAQRPVLLSTVSVKASKSISKMLEQEGVDHQLLNANREADEVDIVQNAGKPGTITVATNIAGRGTDIILSRESKDAGGLAVIGSTVNQSRRIDNQLRGRAGRQGQPGTSQFFVSRDDEIFRVFGTKDAEFLFQHEIKNPLEGVTSKRLEQELAKSQGELEFRDRAIRRLYLELNEYVEKQREALYRKRRDILKHPHLITELYEMIDGEIAYMTQLFAKKKEEKDDRERYFAELSVLLPPEMNTSSLPGFDKKKELQAALSATAKKRYQEISSSIDANTESALLRHLILESIDVKWSNHLEFAHALQDHIPTVSIGKRNPLNVYKKKLQSHYEITLLDIRSQAVRNLFYLLMTGEYHRLIEERPEMEMTTIQEVS